MKARNNERKNKAREREHDHTQPQQQRENAKTCARAQKQERGGGRESLKQARDATKKVLRTKSKKRDKRSRGNTSNGRRGARKHFTTNKCLSFSYVRCTARSEACCYKRRYHFLAKLSLGLTGLLKGTDELPKKGMPSKAMPYRRNHIRILLLHVYGLDVSSRISVPFFPIKSKKTMGEVYSRGPPRVRRVRVSRLIHAR